MTNTVMHFKDAFLTATSSRSISIGLLQGAFDIGFFASSWDRRCVCIADLEDTKFGASVLLLFEDKDDRGLRDEHDTRLKAFLDQHGGAVTEVKGRSVDTKVIWGEISKALFKLAAGHRRPLRIYIDFSTFPRYYSLGLIALCLKSGYVASFTLGYAEGIYPPRTQGHHILDAFPFTSGRWTTTSIPFLGGQLDPSLRKYYFVSVGFEGPKVLRVLIREDPDRVSILFPRPGFVTTYEDISREANSELVERYKIPEEQTVYAAAGDAVAAWKAVTEAALENFGAENVYYLCSGPKPHSLALALRALVTERPAVLYNVPERYGFVDVHPSGVFWRYDITDLSAI